MGDQERIVDEAGEIIEAEQDRLLLIGAAFVAVVCIAIAIGVGVAIGKRVHDA